MSTRELDESLRAMKASHEKLSARKLALQVYLQQGVTDETKTWLQAQIAAHAERIALLDGVMGGMTAVSETDFPELALGDMPPEVQENLDVLDAKLAKTKETMAEMRPGARTKAADAITPGEPNVPKPPTPMTPGESKPGDVTEVAQEQRRGRREGSGA